MCIFSIDHEFWLLNLVRKSWLIESHGRPYLVLLVNLIPLCLKNLMTEPWNLLSELCFDRGLRINTPWGGLRGKHLCLFRIDHWYCVKPPTLVKKSKKVVFIEKRLFLVKSYVFAPLFQNIIKCEGSIGVPIDRTPQDAALIKFSDEIWWSVRSPTSNLVLETYQGLIHTRKI